MKKTILLILIIFSLHTIEGQNINVYAGNGSLSYSGDGGPATSAAIWEASGIAVDTSGNLYIADVGNDRIRRVNISNGNIITIGGNGQSGYNGDNITAISAKLNGPYGIAVDDSGNVYFSDASNNRVRKIYASSHIIITVAGNGVAGYSGDKGLATNAKLNDPAGIKVDHQGNIYIADYGNSRVRLVNKKTGVITTIAGTGTSGYSGDADSAVKAKLYNPEDIVLANNGDLYIADFSNNRIRKITAGIINTVAGNGVAGYAGDNGLATAAELHNPSGLILDKSGNVFFGDQTNGRVREIEANTGIIVTAAGGAGTLPSGQPATLCQLNSPGGLTIDSSGDIYIADPSLSRVFQIKYCMSITQQPVSNNACVGQATTFKVGASSKNVTYQWKVNTGSGFANVTNGSVYSGSDSATLKISRVISTMNGYLYTCIVTKPSCGWFYTDTVKLTTEICDPCDIMYTVAGTGHAGSSGNGGLATVAQFNSIIGVALDTSGNMYIADGANNVIRKVTAATGIVNIIAGGGPSSPGDGGPATAAQFYAMENVAVDDSGNVYVLDNQEVRKVSSKTGIINRIAGGGTNSPGDGGQALLAKLSGAEAVAVDKFSNVYVSTYSDGRVHKISDATGIITTIAGSGSSLGDGGQATAAQLSVPQGIAVDDSGNIYIADPGHYRIRKVNTNGIISTVAGNGTKGYSGDGGPATLAELNSPQGVAVDNSGALYIADGSNYRIRKVKSGIITTVGGNGVSGYNGDYASADSTELTSLNYLAVDDSSNIYISDQNRIREVSVTQCGNYCHPIIKITSSNDSICIGVSDTITASGGGSYLWNNGTTNSKIIINPSITTTYSVVIKNKGGCVNDTSLTITVLALPSATINGVNSICSGTIDTIMAGGGINYAWNNGATSSSIVVNPTSTTTYTVSVSSSICSKDTTFAVTVNSLASLSIIGKNAICPRLNDTIAISGGASYNWNTGATTNQIIVAPLSASTYSVIVKKGACLLDTSISVSINPLPIISARYDTAICNGSYDTIRVSSLNNYTWSNGSTNDSIIINPVITTTYTLIANNGICVKDTSVILKVNPIPAVTITGDSIICSGSSVKLTAVGATNYIWMPGTITTAILSVSPAITTTYTVTGTTNGCNSTATRTVNVAPTNGFDLTGNLYVCIDTPSFSNASIQACIYNNRCMVSSGTLKLVLDTAFHITSTISDSVAHVSGDTLIWNYDSLSEFGKSHCVSLTGSVSKVPAGDSVFVSMFITPTAGDSVPANNSVTYWVKAFPYNCVGLPFDPNEKSVLPEGNISATQQLSYTIHFQNTGTAPAKNVVVVDTLSPYVDPTTIKVTSASSEVSTSIVSGNIVKFTFNDINLPDTATSKTSSIGVVKYTINPAASAQPGDVIYNGAGIYFDANPVVKTNTTRSPIVGTLTSVRNISTSLNIACFPNPFTTTTSIVFNTDGTHYLELDDVTGRKIESMECTGRQYELQRNNLASGVYFIKAFDAEHKYMAVQKVIVQ